MKMKKLLAAALAVCVLTLNVTAMAETTEETTVYTPISATEATKIEAENCASTTGNISGSVVSLPYKEISYNISVVEEGYYDISICNSAQSAGDKLIEVYIDDTLKLVSEAVVTGSYSKYEAVSLGAVKLTADNHKLKLVTHIGMQLDYITIEKAVPTKFRLQAEVNDGANVGATAAWNKTATVHNGGQYIEWQVDIGKAGNYEFRINGYGYKKISRPIIKVDGTTVIECEITDYDPNVTTCVEYIVGTEALMAGSHTITLCNPADGYFTDGTTSGSLFVDWLEIDRVSAITDFRLTADNKTKFDGRTDGGLSNSNQYIEWEIDIDEEGLYSFDISAKSYKDYARPVVYIDGVLAVYDENINIAATEDYVLYNMGEYGLTSGTHTVKLENPSDKTIDGKSWKSKIMWIEYLDVSRVSGFTSYTLEFEAANRSDYGEAEIGKSDVPFWCVNAYAEWDVNTAAGEWEFVLKAGNPKDAYPVIFIDDNYIMQPKIPATDANYTKANVEILKVYLGEGNHTIKILNPSDETYPVNSAALSADSLTIKKVSDVGLTSVKAAGEMIAKANVAGYDKAVLIAAEYSGEDIVSLSLEDEAVGGELETKLTLSDSANTLRLFLWDGTNSIVPHIAAKDY